MINTISTRIHFQGKVLGLVKNFKIEEISADDNGLFGYKLKRLEPGDQGVKKIVIDGKTYLNEQFFEGIIEDFDSCVIGNQKSLLVYLYNMDKIDEKLIDLEGFPRSHESIEDTSAL